VTTRGLGHAIDFGMSTSTIAVCQPVGRTSYMAGPGGHFGTSIQTSIYVKPDGGVLVGNEADNARQADVNRPDAYRHGFKRDFGLPHVTMVRDTPMLPGQMATHVLSYLRQLAQDRVPGDPEHVLITVPASWEAWRHAAMREAAAEAGYSDSVISLVPEPVAALADAFADRSLDGELTALVYDLGGGTFDCAVARGTFDGFEVLGTPGGIGDLGGTEFDGRLLALLGEQHAEALDGLLNGPADDLAVLGLRGSLRRECERIKWELSEHSIYDDVLATVRPPVWLSIPRGDFEEQIRPLVAETIAECDRMLRQLGMTWDDLDRVLPTGGSTKVPLVQRMLADASGRVVLRAGEPARAVVAGAAVLCHTALTGASLEAYTRATPDADARQRDDELDSLIGDPGEPDDFASPAEAASAAEFVALLDRHKDKLPQQRKPNIIVCGGTGTGKTTSINTLFGQEVGEVGYFSRGTSHDELYEWESEGHNIDVVDLPGLGDSRRRDKEYREMYRRRVAKADGFIVVVSPPRPANDDTIDTVNLLLACGVDPERLVFAYNRLTDIRAPVGGQMRQLTLDGLAGPATKHDVRLIEMARKAFNKDLRELVHNGNMARRLPLEKVIAYDALSGWNLFAVLDAVLDTLPGDALMKWRDAVTQAASDLERRTTQRLEAEASENAARAAQLKKQLARLSEVTPGDAPKDGALDDAPPPSPQGDSKRSRRIPAQAAAERLREQSETRAPGGKAGAVRSRERGKELAEAEREPEERRQEAARRAIEDRKRAAEEKEVAKRVKAAADAEARRRREKERKEVARRVSAEEAERERAAAERAAAQRTAAELAAAQRTAAERELKDLIQAQARNDKESAEVLQIRVNRERHVDRTAEKFMEWAGEKIGVAVTAVKGAASALKRWFRGR
jgi:uncharacterized protein